MKNANPLSFRLVAAAMAVVACAGGCGAPDEHKSAFASAHAGISTWFDIGVGGKTVKMQLAVSEEEMAHGLMGRRDLASDQGMLFCYTSPQGMSYYMRNTPTPLDIGFFDAKGVLREVYPLYPYDEKPVTAHSKELQYALEMNQGWFAANGVRQGARLDLDAVNRAVKARSSD